MKFIPLPGKKPLLQFTLERVAPLLDGHADGVACVSGQEHGFLVADCISIGKTGLETIEAWAGGYLGDDGMVRLTDTYGRGYSVNVSVE